MARAARQSEAAAAVAEAGGAALEAGWGCMQHVLPACLPVPAHTLHGQQPPCAHAGEAKAEQVLYPTGPAAQPVRVKGPC